MSSQSSQSPERTRADTEPMAGIASSSMPDSSGDMHNTAPTWFAGVGGTSFAHRRFGKPIGTPIVLLQHFMGNLDNYDPAITDALAMGREVILTDNTGVGHSTGAAPETVEQFKRAATDFVGR
jgi:hypothetical protein